MKTLTAILIIAVVAIGGFYLLHKPQQPTTSESNASSSAPIVGLGAHCGGFIQNAPTCAAGLHCQLVVSRPDVGGTCVSD